MARVEAVPEREAGTFGRFAYGLPRLSEARLVELTATIALENYRVRFTPSAWDRRVLGGLLLRHARSVYDDERS